MYGEFREVQRRGRNRETVINHSYIDSGEYRSKFDEISDDKSLNRKLYQIAKKMLKHRSGTLFEDMYWLDVATLKVVAAETNQKTERKIKYSKRTRAVVTKNKNLVAIHTHPNSMPPSINDFNSAFKNEYKICIICCHDGNIYLYNSKKHIVEFFYKSTISKYRKMGFDDFESQTRALLEFQNNGDIFLKEV